MWATLVIHINLEWRHARNIVYKSFGCLHYFILMKAHYWFFFCLNFKTFHISVLEKKEKKEGSFKTVPWRYFQEMAPLWFFFSVRRSSLPWQLNMLKWTKQTNCILFFSLMIRTNKFLVTLISSTWVLV